MYSKAQLKEMCDTIKYAREQLQSQEPLSPEVMSMLGER